MTQMNWEKPVEQTEKRKVAPTNRFKFLIAGALILAAVAYLIVTSTLDNQRYFITIEELVTDSQYLGQTVRVSGAVMGDTIQFDSRELNLDFTVAHIPQETDDLAHTLYLAANNPNSVQVPVHVSNEVMPDLLQHEAQAILTGHLAEDGIFYADELLLKCPSRYEEAVPGQLAAAEGN